MCAVSIDVHNHKLHPSPIIALLRKEGGDEGASIKTKRGIMVRWSSLGVDGGRNKRQLLGPICRVEELNATINKTWEGETARHETVHTWRFPLPMEIERGF